MILEKCLGPVFQFPTKQCFGNAHPDVSNSCKNRFQKSQIVEQLPHFKFSISATLMFFLHKWEDGSRKVTVNAVNFSPTPWNVSPVISQAVRKPCFSTSIPWGQNPRFPDYWIFLFPDFHLASLGEPGLHDGGTALSQNPNRYPL